jgi:predicted nucleic acid-binding protein
MPSVLVASLFEERVIYRGAEFAISKRAEKNYDAVALSDVEAFAPSLVTFEFMTAAHRKACPREGVAAVRPSLALALFRRFRELKLTVVSPDQLADRAWTLATVHGLSPTDSWFLACAEHTDAELWVSHRHIDGFVDIAESIWPKVYVLTEHRFDDV